MINVAPVASDDPRLAELVTVPAGTRFLLATRAGVPVGCCGLAPSAPGVVRLDPLVVTPGATGAERALLTAAERLAARLGAHTVVLPASRPGLDVAGYRQTPDGVAKRLPRP